MSIKWLITSFMLVSVALSCANAEFNEKDMSSKQLEESFERLAIYLNTTGDDVVLIKMAKNATKKQFFGDKYLRTAANMLVYLYELETCTPKALDYMSYVLFTRRNALPGWLVRTHQGCIEKNRLDKLLEATILRASQKCKSYINSWHDESEQAIDRATKQKLYNLIGHEARARARAKEGERYFIEMLVKVAHNDATVRKKLAKLQTKQQRYQFFRDYIEDSFIKPCNRYLKAMDGVMSRAGRFVFGYRAELFDEPSEGYLESDMRYHYCKKPWYRLPSHLEEIAEEAAMY